MLVEAHVHVPEVMLLMKRTMPLTGNARFHFKAVCTYCSKQHAYAYIISSNGMLVSAPCVSSQSVPAVYLMQPLHMPSQLSAPQHLTQTLHCLHHVLLLLWPTCPQH